MAKHLPKILIAAVLVTISLASPVQAADAPEPEYNFFTANRGGIFKTTNQGDTFTHQVKIQGNSKRNLSKAKVLALKIDPFDDKTVYLLTKNIGLWVSHNSASSWQQLKTGKINDLAFDHQAKGHLYIIAEKQILESSDAGRTWKIIFLEPRNRKLSALATNYQNSAGLLTANRQGDIFRTDNSGKSWQKIVTLKTNNLNGLMSNPNDFSEVYVTTERDGIFKTTSRGATWIRLDNLKKYKGSDDLGEFKFNPSVPSHLFLASKYGLLKSVDSGLSWEPVNLLTAPGKNKIYRLAFDSTDEKIIYYATRTLFCRSLDSGTNWNCHQLPTKQKTSDLEINPQNSDIIYLGVSST